TTRGVLHAYAHDGKRGEPHDHLRSFREPAGRVVDLALLVPGVFEVERSAGNGNREGAGAVPVGPTDGRREGGRAPTLRVEGRDGARIDRGAGGVVEDTHGPRRERPKNECHFVSATGVDA